MVMVRNRSCLRYHVQPQYRKTKCQYSRTEYCPEIRELLRLPQKNGVTWRWNNYIFSVVSCIPAENPDFIFMWRCNSQALSGVQLGRVAKQSLREALLLHEEESLNLQSTAKVWIRLWDDKLCCASYQGLFSGDCRGIASQPCPAKSVIGTGIKGNSRFLKEIIWKPISRSWSCHIKSKMPDMYGWTDENVQTFAKWLNIEVEWEGN